MGGVRVSRTPDSSRTQPDATHDVFSWTRSCETATHKKNSAIYMTDKKRFSTKFDIRQTDDASLLVTCPKSPRVKIVPGEVVLMLLLIVRYWAQKIG